MMSDVLCPSWPMPSAVEELLVQATVDINSNPMSSHAVYVCEKHPLLILQSDQSIWHVTGMHYVP